MINSLDQSLIDNIESLRKAHQAFAKQVRDTLDVQELRIIGLPPPPPIDLFRGRVQELEALAKYLSIDSIPLISVIGDGGTGKTALVRKLLDDYAQSGIWPISQIPSVRGIIYLSTRTSGISLERLYFECAQLLGGSDELALENLWKAPKTPLSHKINQLIDMLGSRYVIIMLDNFEDELTKEGHIREGDLATFFQIIRNRTADHNIRIIITSRIAPVWKKGEYDDYVTLQFSGISSAEALILLRNYHAGHAEWLEAIGQSKLDTFIKETGGSPRALELLASIYDHNPDQSMDELLSLIRNARAASPDQPISSENDHLMDALAGYHYDVLSANEQLVMCALAVFNRPVPQVALRYLLWHLAPQVDIGETINRLRASYAITYETPRVYGSERPVSSLHTIDRDIALKRLANPSVWHRQAAGYYALMHLDPPWASIRQIEPHLLEINHCLLAEDYDQALAVLNLLDYSPTRQHKYLASLMALGYGEYAIQLREKLIWKLSSLQAEALNLTSLGWVYRRMNKINPDKGVASPNGNAITRFVQACQVADASGDDEARWFAHSEYGYLLTDNLPEHTRAQEELKIALKIADQHGDSYWQAHCHLGLAFAAFQLNENDTAIQETETALAAFQKVDSKLAHYREVDCWTRLNLITRKMQQYEEANEYINSGINVALANGFEDWVAELESGLGFNERGQAKFEVAVAYHLDALSLFRLNRGMKREEAVQHSYIGNLYVDLGDFVKAHDEYEEAERIADNIGIIRERSWILGTRGILEAKQGNWQVAEEYQKKAIRIALENNHLDSLVVRHTDLAVTYQLQERWGDAQAEVLLAMQCAARDKDRSAILPQELPSAYLDSPVAQDKLSHEMQSPGDDQRRGIVLARTYLHHGDLANARRVIERARQADVLPHQPTTAAIHALILARLGEIDHAQTMCRQAIEYATGVINTTEKFYVAHYAHGLALTLMKYLDSHNTQGDYLEQALLAYRKALSICQAQGVVRDARQLLHEVSHLDKIFSEIDKMMFEDGIVG